MKTKTITEVQEDVIIRLKKRISDLEDIITKTITEVQEDVIARLRKRISDLENILTITDSEPCEGCAHLMETSHVTSHVWYCNHAEACEVTISSRCEDEPPTRKLLCALHGWVERKEEDEK